MQVIKVYIARESETAQLVTDGDGRVVWAQFNARGQRVAHKAWSKDTTDEATAFIRRAIDRLVIQGWRITEAPATRGLALIGRGEAPEHETLVRSIRRAEVRVAAMPAGEDKALAAAALQEARHFARCARPVEARKSLARIA
jgi:hypothetical protein